MKFNTAKSLLIFTFIVTLGISNFVVENVYANSDDYDNAKNQLAAKLKEKEQELKEKQKEKKTRTTNIDKKKQTLAQIKDKEKNLIKKKNRQSKKELEKFEKEIQNLNKEIEQEQSELMKSQDAEQKLSENVKALQASLDKLQNEIEEAKKREVQDLEDSLLSVYKSRGSNEFKEQCTKKIEIWKIAADNDATAQTLVGYCYLHGYDKEAPNEEKAFDLFSKAAKNNYIAHAEWQHLDHQRELNEKLKNDLKFSENTKKNIGDNAHKQYFQKNCQEKISIWESAAKDNNSEAQVLLGYCLRYGYEKILPNNQEAQRWFEQAARQSNQIVKAIADIELQHISSDKKLSQGELEKTMEIAKNSTKSENQKAIMKQTEPELESFKSESESKQQTEKNSPAFDFDEAVTMKKKTGDNIQYFQKNCRDKISTWRIAADANDAIAQVLLGYCYLHGSDIADKNNKTAVGWFYKSANQNNPIAQSELGYIFSGGYYGVRQNPDESKNWNSKAAEQGNFIGQNNLAALYTEQEKYGDALILFQKSAEQGYAVAQYNLGYLYENGFGVTKNYQTALDWYKKAESQGYEKAKEKLRSLEAEKIK